MGQTFRLQSRSIKTVLETAFIQHRRYKKNFTDVKNMTVKNVCLYFLFCLCYFSYMSFFFQRSHIKMKSLKRKVYAFIACTWLDLVSTYQKQLLFHTNLLLILLSIVDFRPEARKAFTYSLIVSFFLLPSVANSCSALLHNILAFHFVF